MFSSVLARSELPRRPLGAGVAAAVLVHAAALLVLAHVAVRAPPELPPVAVTFARPPPPPPPPAPAPVERAPRPVAAKPAARPPLVPPKVEPAPAVPEAPPAPAAPAAPEPAAEVGGEAGGVAGGTVGGVVGSTAPISAVDADPAARLDYDATMAPPRLVSGPSIQYTPQALEREVEGLMVVKCVVTVEGAVHGCRVLQSVPYMDATVVRALERRRYTPATLHGRPLDVNYTFKIRLVLPR